MNWENLNQIVALRTSGRVEESIAKLEELRVSERDTLANAIALMEIVNGLRLLKRHSEARTKIDEACALLGPEHEFYPRLAFLDALIEMDNNSWKSALSKLDLMFERYQTILRSEDHGDLLDEVQRNRGTALMNLQRFAEAVPLLESVRSIEFDREATLCDLGVCQFKLREYDSAKETFEELLSLGPNSRFRANAHYNLGIIMFYKGFVAKGKREFEECLRCPDRVPLSDDNLLDWLITCSKELAEPSEVQKYTEMKESLRTSLG